MSDVNRIEVAEDVLEEARDTDADANNYLVYNIPKIFQGKRFLIARCTLTRTPSGYTWTLSEKLGGSDE